LDVFSLALLYFSAVRMAQIDNGDINHGHEVLDESSTCAPEVFCDNEIWF
jgi:hypothetical protein